MKKNHAPILVTLAAPPETAASDSPIRPDRLLLPEKLTAPCPLAVLIEDDRDCAWEAEQLKNQGYAVFCCEARRSMEGSRESRLDWQLSFEKKLEELFTAQPCLDRSRVFLDGWMSAFLVFRSNGFRAAVQRAALLDMASAYGNCAPGQTAPFGSSFKEMLRSLTEQSVIAEADSCKTPLLVLYQQGEERYCPEQSEILYSVMKDRNPEVPCRLAVFPETASKERVLREITDWWRRFD